MANVIHLSKYRPAPLNPKHWREKKALDVARRMFARFSIPASETEIQEFARESILPALKHVKRNPEARKVRHG